MAGTVDDADDALSLVAEGVLEAPSIEQPVDRCVERCATPLRSLAQRVPGGGFS